MNNRETILKEDDYLLTKSQYVSIIFGSMIGLSVLNVPNYASKIAYQDGWIATAIGAIYPFYMVAIAIYISKKSPQDNILTLSKKYLGNILAGILNLIFLTYFIFEIITITNDYSYMMRNYVIDFLTPLKVMIVAIFLAAYTASNGLKVIGRISEVAFFLTIMLIISPISALKTGRITNIYPVLDSGLKAIFQGGIESSRAYTGVEIIFLIYPFLKEKNKIVSSSFKSVFFVTIIYIWTAFITIYYIGSDVINISNWSFLLVTESVTITVLNNYRYIFILVWSLVIFKSISIFYWSSIYIINNYIRKIKYNKLVLIMFPLLVYISSKYGNIIEMKEITTYIMKSYIIFNMLYVTLIAVIIFITTLPKQN